MTAQPIDSARQAGSVETYEGRGVWVPDGLSARDIMVAAFVLEQNFDVAPYMSRDMAIQVLRAIQAERTS